MNAATSEAVQVVQDLYAAFGQGNLPAVLELLDEDVDWWFTGQPGDIPFAGRWQGRGRVKEFFALLAETCDILEFGPDEILCFDEHVISIGQEQVRVRATGRIFRTAWVHIFKVEKHKIVRLRKFYDTAVMARAFHSYLARSPKDP